MRLTIRSLAALAVLFVPAAARAADPLPSWKDGPSTTAILDFVARVTKEGGPDFVPPADRIAVFDNDGTLWSGGEKALVELVMATHAGMTSDEFDAVAREWLATARHPRFKRPYTDLVYQPMLELLAYLRANGFKVYIVTGGGVEFVRVIVTGGGWTGKATQATLPGCPCRHTPGARRPSACTCSPSTSWPTRPGPWPWAR